MSEKPTVKPGPSLREVKVEALREKPRRNTHGQIYTLDKGVAPKVSSMSSDFVYVNATYSGSLNSVNERRFPAVQEPPTSVLREQYWACSKWPYTQRVLALAVGVLLGAVVGLAVTLALRTDDKDGGGIGGIFRSYSAPH